MSDSWRLSRLADDDVTVTNNHEGLDRRLDSQTLVSIVGMLDPTLSGVENIEERRILRQGLDNSPKGLQETPRQVRGDLEGADDCSLHVVLVEAE
jgi:hypothetical protein